jgi:hypothetical protein
MKQLFLILGVAVSLNAQPTSDQQAVRRAALDYIDALYNADPSLIERSVHKDLDKRGFYWDNDAYKEGRMSYAELIKLAGTWNQGDKRKLAQAARDVTVYEVNDQTASAKVTAQWGLDYLLLAKYEGRWKIIEIVWQSPPKKPATN